MEPITTSPEESTLSVQEMYQFDAKERKPKRKMPKGLKIWILIVLGIALLGALIAASGFSVLNGETLEAPDSPYIGVLYVEGTIAASNVDSWGVPYGYQHQFTLDTIDEMIADPNNKALLFYVDSPGGGVYESDELYFKIKEYQDVTGRPVFSYMASMAASGGYYISAPADEIYANRNCWTGSIGVTIGTVYDISELLHNYGIKTVTITSGRNKAMGSMVDPLTAEQQAIFQSLVDEAYEQFTAIVAEGRQMDLATVKNIADGRIYSAKQAYDLGLVDTVCSYEDALADIAGSYDLSDCEVFDFYYVDDSLFGALLQKAPLPDLPSGDTEAVLSLIQNDVEFPISYLCEALDQ